MKIDSLLNLLVAGLRETYDCERRLVRAFPELCRQAESPELRDCLTTLHARTEEQMRRLEDVFDVLGTSPDGWRCAEIPVLLDADGEGGMEENTPLYDAVIVATCQRIAHFLTAAYRSAASRARHLGYTEPARLLDEARRCEEQADAELTVLAERFHGETAAEARTPAAPRKAA